jgi:hypothetical protein
MLLEEELEPECHPPSEEAMSCDADFLDDLHENLEVETESRRRMEVLAEATARATDTCSPGPLLADLRGRAREVLTKASLDGSILEAMSAAQAQVAEQKPEPADNTLTTHMGYLSDPLVPTEADSQTRKKWLSCMRCSRRTIAASSSSSKRKIIDDVEAGSNNSRVKLL